MIRNIHLNIPMLKYFYITTNKDHIYYSLSIASYFLGSGKSGKRSYTSIYLSFNIKTSLSFSFKNIDQIFFQIGNGLRSIFKIKITSYNNIFFTFNLRNYSFYHLKTPLIIITIFSPNTLSIKNTQFFTRDIQCY